jgi:aminocarboxymuconate-semialdehyde decarboxylase
MIPFFHKRVELSWDFNVRRMGYQPGEGTAAASPVDAYRAFYCDTAIQGNTSALMCAYEFFGVDHMVFATDSPYDDEYGARVYRETIPAVQAMSIPQADKQQIFEGNARRLFRIEG